MFTEKQDRPIKVILVVERVTRLDAKRVEKGGRGGEAKSKSLREREEGQRGREIRISVEPV
jgi:hypothetical protein